MRPIILKPFSTYYYTEPYNSSDRDNNSSIKSLGAVKVVIRSRTGGGAIAEVIGGQVELRLKLGLVRRLLYMIRPGMLLTLLGWSVALATASVGCLGLFISGSALMWAGPALVTRDDDRLTVDQDELDYRARTGSGRVGGRIGGGGGGSDTSPSSSFIMVPRSSSDGDKGGDDDGGSDILYNNDDEREERRRDREIKAMHTAELMEKLYEDEGEEEEEEEAGGRERRRVLRWRRNAAKMGPIPPPPSF